MLKFLAGVLVGVAVCVLAAVVGFVNLVDTPPTTMSTKITNTNKGEDKMNAIKKAMVACLSLLMLLSCIPAVFAATVPEATIDTSRKGSLTIYKYDMTNARKDGVWKDDSFISTGIRESYVEDTLGNAIRRGDADNTKVNALGNGQNSNGYALKGVEFTTAKVAEIVTFTESGADGHDAYNLTQVLYGFDKVKASDLLAAIGLADGAGRYTNADKSRKLDHSKWYYTSEALNNAMSKALVANETTLKDALEKYIATAPGATTMPLTNEDGKTMLRNLPVGLYLTVETKVPEMVTSTTNPFFVSIPMTTVDGDKNSASHNGGTQWNYDVTIYPKNETGIPTLEKTVRESKKDTGKNNGSSSITDGFAHNATGSAGDVMEYQFISTLPTITSKATSLTTYNFYDTLCAGLSYNKNAKDVKIEIFRDKYKVATWTQTDKTPKFTVTYSSDDRNMTVDVNASGLADINGESANANGLLYRGFSNYTVRVTYTATINSDDSFIYGDAGNDNTVVLTWKRTSSDYFDTLIDDCHVYSFGLDLTKLFSDKDSAAADAAGMFGKVQFKVQNATDGYYVVAKRDEQTGIYYVTDHVKSETDATTFTTVTVNGKPGHLVIKGLEDDEYIITEVATANGYTLLKDNIHVTISSADDPTRPCDIYGKDILGVLQNDPHYTFDGGMDLHLANIPQTQLAHNMLTASAVVDGNAVDMTDGGSLAQLTVVNTPGFNVPPTGDTGAWVFGVFGAIGLMAGATIIIMMISKKRKENEQ